MTATTVIVQLPPVFYEDHVDRVGGYEPVGTVVRSTKRHVFVELDAAAYDELLSDARHYADTQQFPEFLGLVTSAKATVRALAKVERPIAEPGG